MKVGDLVVLKKDPAFGSEMIRLARAKHTDIGIIMTIDPYSYGVSATVRFLLNPEVGTLSFLVSDLEVVSESR